MGRPLFTPEELEELRRIDAEIDKNFVMTPEEYRASTQRDRQGRKPPRGMDPATARAARNARQKVYYQTHREEILEKQKVYRDSHRGYMRDYRAANRERLLEYQRVYDASHAEEKAARQKAYYQAHREEILAKARERNARKRKSGGCTT